MTVPVHMPIDELRMQMRSYTQTDQVQDNYKVCRLLHPYSAGSLLLRAKGIYQEKTQQPIQL